MGRCASKAEAAEPLKTTLFSQQADGVTFRIPALIYLRHSSSFLAIAERRSSPCDTHAKRLVMRRGTYGPDGSLQWSSCQELSTAFLPDHRTMNPCPLFENNTKTLFLFFICVPENVSERHQILTGRNQARLCYVSSRDEGRSWSAARDLTVQTVGKAVRKWATFGVGPGHGVQLENGRLVVPAYAYYIPFRCFCYPLPFTVQPRALAVYSDDLGHTWHIGTMLKKKSCECEMAEILDREGESRLYCNARNTRGSRLEALSWSSGDGFNKPRPAPRLVEPRHGCQGSVISFPALEATPSSTAPLSPDTKTWLLFTHPTSRRGRRDLGVYLNRSPLQPSGWERPWVVHRGPAGYSDLAYAEGRGFSCLLECGEQSEVEQIAFLSFSLADVMQNSSQERGQAVG